MYGHQLGELCGASRTRRLPRAFPREMTPDVGSVRLGMRCGQVGQTYLNPKCSTLLSRRWRQNETCPTRHLQQPDQEKGGVEVMNPYFEVNPKSLT